jgi:hypothetical protein
MYPLTNPFQISVTSLGQVKIENIKQYGHHSKHQFMIIRNCRRELKLLETKHEILNHSDAYYYEVPDGFVPMASASSSLDRIASTKLLKNMFEILCKVLEHKLNPCNIVLNPNTIFINADYEVLFTYLPVRTNYVLSNYDVLRLALLTVASVKVEMDSLLFSQLLSLTCEENNLFKESSRLINETMLFVKPKISRRVNKNIFAMIKEFFVHTDHQKNSHLTKLISTFERSSHETHAKFVDINSNEHLIDKGDSLIGRDFMCSIHFDNPNLSRKHLAIHEMNNIVQIRDLNSSNGTMLNGVRMDPHKWYSLKDSDSIEIANQKLWFNRIS